MKMKKEKKSKKKRKKIEKKTKKQQDHFIYLHEIFNEIIFLLNNSNLIIAKL